jgi:hypothetical protein
MTRRFGFVLVLAGALIATSAWGLDDPRDALDQARAEMARIAREYRAALESVLKFQTEAARRATETADQRRRLQEQGMVSRREAEEAETAAAAAREQVEQTRARMVEADRMVTEAEAPQSPLRPGELHTAPSLIRFRGPGQWSLSMAPRVQRFFTERFGRPLPVSALGQTPLHDRLGFDHRNALDVALHPDTLEGQALMMWLRGEGISFLAFRYAVTGAATGAHVHVGEPSPPLALLQR